MKLSIRGVVGSAILNAGDEPNEASHRWGYVFGALGAVLFSMKAIFVKLAYMGEGVEQVDAITLMALRLGFSLPFYIGILYFATRKLETPLKVRDIIFAGLIGVLGYYVCAWLDIQGLKYITAQLERLLLFTYPVFVLLISAIFLGRRPPLKAIVGIVIAYSGIAVIFAGGDIASGPNVPLGTVMVLGCAFFFACFQLLAKPMITRLSSPVFTCLAMISAGTVIFIHLLTQATLEGELSSVLDLSPRLWGLGVALAFISTLIPSFLVNIAIGRIGAQATATLGLLSPIATIVFAIMWLGEPFGPMDGLGTTLTIIGIGLYTYWNQPRSDTPR